MKRTIKLITTILSITILGIFAVIFMKILIFPTVGTRHLLHLASPPEDLYKPIITDDFLFYEKGFTRTYSLQPKYLDFYNIGFLVENCNLSSKYKFSGKVKVDFYWKDKLLCSKQIISQISAAYSNSDLKHFSDVLLLSFEIPFQGKYKDDISVRLTVLEPDEGLKEYGDSIKLFIGVSPIP